MDILDEHPNSLFAKLEREHQLDDRLGDLVKVSYSFAAKDWDNRKHRIELARIIGFKSVERSESEQKYSGRYKEVVVLEPISLKYRPLPDELPAFIEVPETYVHSPEEHILLWYLQESIADLITDPRLTPVDFQQKLAKLLEETRWE